MNAPRRNNEGEEISYQTNESSTIKGSSVIGRIGRKLFLPLLASLALMAPNEAEADQNPVDASCVDVDDGVIHTIGDVSVFVPEGMDLIEFTNMEENGVKCARGNSLGTFGTYCPYSGLYRVSGYEVYSAHNLGGALLVSSGSGFEVDIDGDLETIDSEPFNTRLVEGSINGLSGFEFKRLSSDTGVVLSHHVASQGLADYGFYMVSVDSNGINYDQSSVLNFDVEDYGLNLSVVSVKPSVIGNKIYTVFEDSFTDSKVIVSVTIDDWSANTSDINIVSVEAVVIDGLRDVNEVFHDDGDSFYFFGDGQTYSYNYNFVPPVDTDSDGVPDVDDNCPEDANPNQEDIDNNGIGDECEDPIVVVEDDDNDGVIDADDNCLAIPNPNQNDGDNDGVGNACDNCPEDANANQDPSVCVVEDRDGDGVIDMNDNCPEVDNPRQVDSDFDGIGNVCDLTPCEEGTHLKSGEPTHEDICSEPPVEDAGNDTSDTDTDTPDTGNNDTNVDTGSDTGTVDTGNDDTGTTVEPDVPEEDVVEDTRTITPDVTVPENDLGEPSSAEPAPSCSTAPVGTPVKKGPWGVLVATLGTGLAWFRRKK